MYLVCPKCKRPATGHRFRTGNFVNETYYCPEHGNITPMRSAVVNDYPLCAGLERRMNAISALAPELVGMSMSWR